MSYSRFTEDSNVYVYQRASDLRYECCACSISHLGPTPDLWCFIVDTPAEMVAHLMAHMEAGDLVPQYAIDDLAAGVAR